MTEAIWAAIIGALVPLVIFYVQRRKDIERQDADVARKYQEIAFEEAEARQILEERLNAKIEKLTKENGKLRECAERLVRQLKDNGHTPEPYEVKDNEPSI